MAFKSLLIAAAGLAAVSDAFLIVPAASSGEPGAGWAPLSLADSPLPIEALRTAESQILELDCPGCPIALQNHRGEVRVLTDVASHLQLNFTIAHEPETDKLLLNDFPLYPEIHPSPGREALMAPQIPYFWMQHHLPDMFRRQPFRHATHSPHRRSLEPKLGYRMQTLTYPAKERLSLVALDIQIFQVGHMSVDGIQNVHVTLIKGPNKSLLLRSVETTVSRTLQPTPMDKHEECTTLMCKWASIVQDRLPKIKPAFKYCSMMGGHNGKGPHAHGGGPNHRRPAVFVDGHGPKPGWLQLFRNIAAHILIPIAVGLMAGVIFSLIGMALGTLVVTLWRALFRRSSTRHQSRRGGSVSKTSRRETAPAEEKSGLLEQESQDDEEDDVPPKYEEGEDKIVV